MTEKLCSALKCPHMEIVLSQQTKISYAYICTPVIFVFLIFYHGFIIGDSELNSITLSFLVTIYLIAPILPNEYSRYT